MCALPLMQGARVSLASPAAHDPPPPFSLCFALQHRSAVPRPCDRRAQGSQRQARAALQHPGGDMERDRGCQRPAVGRKLRLHAHGWAQKGKGHRAVARRAASACSKWPSHTCTAAEGDAPNTSAPPAHLSPPTRLHRQGQLVWGEPVRLQRRRSGLLLLQRSGRLVRTHAAPLSAARPCRSCRACTAAALNEARALHQGTRWQLNRLWPGLTCAPSWPCRMAQVRRSEGLGLCRQRQEGGRRRDGALHPGRVEGHHAGAGRVWRSLTRCLWSAVVCTRTPASPPRNSVGGSSCECTVPHARQPLSKEPLCCSRPPQIGCAVATCTTNSPWGSTFPTWTFVVCQYRCALPRAAYLEPRAWHL